MRAIKKRPMRKCARTNHAVPLSESGGICDFMSLSNTIINPSPANGTFAAQTNSSDTHSAEDKPLALRQLEVINEICRRYVGYLIWVHETCKSAPETIEQLAEKCEKFNDTFFKSEKEL